MLRARALEQALNRAIDRTIIAHGDEVFIGEGYSGRESLLTYFAQEVAGASPQAETSRCAETCGLLRCRLNEGHSGLHQVYNAATGDFQQFIGQPAPVSPVEPEPPTLEPCAHELDYHNCAECVGPKVEPEPCVWRLSANGNYADAGCRPTEFFELISVTEWAGCPYCLAPLKVEKP